MATIALTDALRRDYESLFNSCVISAARAAEVDGLVRTLVRNQPRYEAASAISGVPWHFIAVIHNMECGQRFDCHLHNGDPLSARTTHVPAGRPRGSPPPFTWEDSAADALAVKGLGAATDWSLAGLLYQAERYNGFGYRSYHPQVPTPYLWSFSNHYVRGKYVADGTWSDTAVSRQCGVAVLLRRLAETGAIGFADQLARTVSDGPLIVRYAARKPTDPAVTAQADALQRWLNTYAGVFVKLDGYPGKRTSAAFRAVTGHYLPGDPRSAA
ncbi:hypothetical protein LMG23992_04332 [Cupriavidus laharis]|uniref:Peptidoglycan-binding protein n=1 Tax=Cupriavidus laharis TaxID=151654 RepID=A0ABM8XL03_9BURK|nr:hypothetical protein [Cupriavidus laharis]CAG9180885.1 hypothetical protein LMG23992_04332 [Cupriavidus laharis]